MKSKVMNMIWPNGAKTAISLGIDLDGDTIWRNKIKAMPNGASYIKGPSIGLFGPKRGALRILDILDEFDIKTTWFVPALIVQQHAEIVKEALARGHELAHHGLDHTGFYGENFESQKARIEQCQEIFVKYAGVRAYGLRPTGELLPETEEWLFSGGGFLYHSTGGSGEACDFYKVNGKKTGGVNIPCRDEQTDDYVQTVYHNYPAVLVGMPRIAFYDTVYNNWIREVEGAVRFGNSGSTAFHPQISGAPGRAIILRRFCEYLANHSGVWNARCIDIARHFISSEKGGAA